jgi:hypothetical protein
VRSLFAFAVDLLQRVADFGQAVVVGHASIFFMHAFFSMVHAFVFLTGAFPLFTDAAVTAAAVSNVAKAMSAYFFMENN